MAVKSETIIRTRNDGISVTSPERPDLLGLIPEELARVALGLDQPAYRGRQLAEWMYRRGAFDFEAMTNLPAAFRARLAATHRVRPPAGRGAGQADPPLHGRAGPPDLPPGRRGSALPAGDLAPRRHRRAALEADAGEPHVSAGATDARGALPRGSDGAARHVRVHPDRGAERHDRRRGQTAEAGRAAPLQDQPDPLQPDRSGKIQAPRPRPDPTLRGTSEAQGSRGDRPLQPGRRDRRSLRAARGRSRRRGAALAPPPPMLGTLRQRLLALFFLVALVPSLGLTLFVPQYLAKSLAALRNPETERALGQSLEVIRQGIERLGSDAQHHATSMATDDSASRLISAGRLADAERWLRDEARERGLDYVALYPSDGGKRGFAPRSGPRITMPTPDPESLKAALNEGGLVSGGDVPRQVSGVANFGKNHLILVGYQLDPEISSEIEALQKNLTMYRRLGVYTWLSERSLWVFASLWSLVLGAVSFFLAVVVSRGITKPILELESGMERVSGSDLAHRVAPQG